jgi:hypothetical protein
VGTRIDQVTRDILEHAFLYDDPDSFRAGVMQTARALDHLDPDMPGEPRRLDRREPETCPECMIPLDEAGPDDAHCPWCGARNAEPLQELVWAELRAVEAAWPEALGI